MSRSDFTNQPKPILYSDIPMDLDKNPLSNQLGIVVNEQSVKQSLKCLILTNLGDRPYNSTIGSDIQNQLFEQDDNIAINNIKFAITNCIDFNEPRVKIVSLNITPSSDDNYLNVSLIFSLVNYSSPITLNLILKRIR